MAKLALHNNTKNMSHTTVLANLDEPVGPDYLDEEKKFYINKSATPLAYALITCFVGFNFSYNI